MALQPDPTSGSPTGAAERVERAATLLLATSALAAAAMVGWGGLALDLRPLAALGASLYRAIAEGSTVAPTLDQASAALRWTALAPIAGTLISVLFWWHAVSLVAELVLLVAASLGWLWNRSLRPLWLILDVLNCAPLAAPKRLVVATALAGQVLVRSAGPSLAAPLATPVAAVIADESPAEPAGATVPEQTPVADEAWVALRHRVQPGDTMSGMAGRYYGHAGLWPVIWKANEGAIMTEPPLGVGRPVRLTSPNHLLSDWEVRVPLVAGHLERGEDDALVYVVQRGDTLSRIGQRFGVDVNDLAAWNVGAEGPDGRVFDDPDLIWPGLRLRLQALAPETEPAEDVSTPSEPAPATEPAPVVEAPAPGQSSVPAPSEPTTVPLPLTPVTGGLANGHTVPAVSTEAEPAPTVAPVVPTAARPTASDASPAQWPSLLAAGGLSAAALLALRAGHARRRRPQPESETELDVDAFTVAAPAAVATARRGGAADPHGVVLGEQVAGALLQHTRGAGLTDAQVVSVRVGRTGCTVAFETALEQRSRLEATLRTALHLARRLTVSRSGDQDVVAQLDDLQRAALERVSLEEAPLLLCVGLQPDTRAYLVGWEAVGHVLVATQPGTTDAQEHLASLVATLAGQCAPAGLQLYTLAPRDTLLGQLAPLPHQRAVVDPGDERRVADLLAGLREEVERRQQGAVSSTAPELVLVVGELASVVADNDLAYVLEHGRAHRVRVLAASADTQVQRGPLVDTFESRLIFALEDEEASTRLLGKPWALTLAEPGRLLARLGRRNAVEILGLRLTDEGRRDLLASAGASEEAPPESMPADRAEEPREPVRGEEVVPHEQAGDDAGRRNGESVDVADRADPAAAVESACQAAVSSDLPAPATNGVVIIRTVPGPAHRADDGTTPLAPPERIARLLERAPLVIDCEDAAVWSSAGRLPLEPSRPLEMLFYLAAAPLLEQLPVEQWPGVETEVLLQEVWAPGARDPKNRESSQTWLVKTVSRLEEEIRRVCAQLPSEDLVRRASTVRLNRDVAVSDIEAFMAAIERARAARGLDQIAAAEEALALRVPNLLPRARLERRGIGNRRIELYRWLVETHWERAAGRLEALGRDAARLVARAYRDAGRHEEALAVYAGLLGEDPLDPRAQEGLLAAAAGTGDVAQLHEAWEQVCACLGGEDDPEVRARYEDLLREMERRSASGGRSGNGVAAVAR